jgi:translation initiation factor IF-2
VFETINTDKAARNLANDRKETADRERQEPTRAAITLEDIFAAVKTGQAKELNMILKVDVHGTLQPILEQIEQLSTKNSEGIRVRMLAADVGNISESDVMLASASGAIIVGFSVNADNAARRYAEANHVDIRMYDIIYKLFEDIELALQGMLEPVYADKVIGVAEVRQVIRISKVGNIAGSFVREGEIRRNARARVRRGNQVLIENTTVSALKRFNEDVREVRTGFECGISLNNFADFHEGDLIEFFVSERVS